MTAKLDARQVDNIFITISCIELFLGLLRLCHVTLPFSRYLLWFFTLFYVAVAAVRQYSKREKIVFGVLMVFGTLLYINTGLNKGIRGVFYLFALKGMDMRKYYKSMLIVLVTSSVFFAVLSKCGFLGIFTIQDVRSNRGFNGLRYCFGYENANRAMAVMFFALVCGLILYHEKWYSYAVMAVIYVILFYLTDSRTGFIVGAAVLAGVCCVQYIRWEGWSGFVFSVFTVVFAAMLVISVLAAFRAEFDWLDRINHFISGRMNQLAKYTCDTAYALPYVENWHLFGDRGNHNDYDLGYIQIFYYYGIVPAVCYLSCVVGAAVKVWRDNEAWKLVLLLGLCVYLFMESVYFSNFVPVDFLLVYAISLLWGDYGKRSLSNG